MVQNVQTAANYHDCARRQELQTEQPKGCDTVMQRHQDSDRPEGSEVTRKECKDGQLAMFHLFIYLTDIFQDTVFLCLRQGIGKTQN